MNDKESRRLLIDRTFVLVPITSEATHRRVRLTKDGAVLREFTAALGLPAQWWAHIDVSAWTGESPTLSIEPYEIAGMEVPGRGADETDDAELLAAIHTSDDVWSPETLYREARRPQLRFSSRRGWLNDPHVVFHEGEYHLYYQHNPYSCSWGNGHWGHAISADLVHWRELPIAIYPDEGCIMQSGSVVVDWQNRAGLPSGAEETLVALYTTRGRMTMSGGRLHHENEIPPTQGLAFSNDRGRTWTKYEDNPVIPYLTDEARDPNVFWYEPDRKWVMALYMDANDFSLFSSRDLTHWDKMSDITIPGDIECPELIEFAIDGDPGNTRWIFYGVRGLYLIGDFDGETFTPESGPHQLQHGNSWHASQWFREMPASDGRCIIMSWALAWGTGTYDDMPFSQAMGIPVELTLRTTDEGPRLFSNPVEELTSLRQRSHHSGPTPLRDGEEHPAGIAGDLLEFEVEIGLGSATEIRFEVRGTQVVYDVPLRQLSCAGVTAPLEPEDGRIRLRILVDRTVIDIFGNAGRLYMPIGVLTPAGEGSVSITARGGDAQLESLEVFELTSTWA